MLVRIKLVLKPLEAPSEDSAATSSSSELVASSWGRGEEFPSFPPAGMPVLPEQGQQALARRGAGCTLLEH